jgi:hypothetical protein
VNGLYFIIRRKRRPLLVEDSPPALVADVEPVNAEAAGVKDEAVGNEPSGEMPEAVHLEDED